jgi:hypothetical protein
MTLWPAICQQLQKKKKKKVKRKNTPLGFQKENKGTDVSRQDYESFHLERVSATRREEGRCLGIFFFFFVPPALVF